MVREAADIKKLQAKEAKERKRHHKAQANALQAQVREAEAMLSEGQNQYAEVGTAIEESKVNVAELQAQYAKAVETRIKETIDEANSIFEAHLSGMQLSETLAEGQLHREGLDFSGLEEAKGKQEGVLNSAQIGQAQKDYAEYKRRHEEQIAEDKRQRAYDESQLGSLSGEDRTSLEKTIEGLAANINDLQNQMLRPGEGRPKS